MKIIKPLLIIVALALVATGCSLFGGDGDTTPLSSAEGFEAEPTANVVEAAPAATLPPAAAAGTVELDEAGQPIEPVEGTGTAASAALPTAIALPAAPEATEVPLDRTQPTSYVVQGGDVLGLIAERFDVDIAELRRVNDLSGNLIRVGQTLTIPAISGAAAPADEVAGSSETAAPAPAATRAPAATPAPVSCGAGAVGHCVQSGDSLLGIASSNGVSVDALRAANPSLSGDLIRIGDLLTIPGQSGATTGGTTTGGTTGGSAPVTTVEAVVVAPTSNADCAARNAEFPYFHAADGLCYANPIGGTAEAEQEARRAENEANGQANVSCEDGKFLYTDGLCYPIPGYEATSTPVPDDDASGGTVSEDFGRPPCDDWEVVLENNKCWPADTATDAQREAGKVGAATATPTPVS